MPVSLGPFLEPQLGETIKVFVNGHINGRGTASLRTSLRFCSGLIVTGMTERHVWPPVSVMFSCRKKFSAL